MTIHFRQIAFDCKDWRRTRIGELRLMAQVAAERVSIRVPPSP